MEKHFRDYGIDLPDYFKGDRKIPCPKCSASRHKPNDPCLSVNGESGMWKCHNCGWSGRREDTAPERYRAEAEEHHYRRPELPKKTDVAPQVAAYFGRRGIGGATLERCRVFSTFRYLPGTGAETLCMAFPYYRNGELLNVKYRDARKNMSQEKDPEPCLWNIDAAAGADVIYITEGEIDALTLVECGFPSAVSVDRGAPQPKDQHTDKKLACVENCMEVLQNAETVVLVTDKDEPGLILERELISRIGAAKCKLVRYPEGCKDINDVLVKHTSAGVLKVIAGAYPAPVPGLRQIEEFSSDIEAYYRKGQPRRYSTGFASLDEHFSLQPGSVNIFTGIPQSGKTEFVHQLVVNAIRLHGWKAAVFSPEMLPVENIFANFAEKWVGKPFFGRGDDRMSFEELRIAERTLSESIKVILPDADKSPTVDDLLAAAQVSAVRYGCKMFVFDPYNEIEHTRVQWMTETEYVSFFMAKLRNFARLNKVWVGLVAHPTKLRKDEKTKKYPVATLYDISGSANFANKTDNGLSLWREQTPNCHEVQVHILKVKSKFIGRANTHIALNWDRRTGTFSEPAPVDASMGPQ